MKGNGMHLGLCKGKPDDGSKWAEIDLGKIIDGLCGKTRNQSSTRL